MLRFMMARKRGRIVLLFLGEVVVGSRTHGRGTFCAKQKVPKKFAPLQPALKGKPQLPTLPTRRSDSQSRSQTSICRPWQIATIKDESCGRLYKG